MSPKATGVKQLAQNRKAYHDYFIEEKYEAGIELFGTEVKSIRMGNVNLRDSFCVVRNGEIFVVGMHISPYEKGNIFNRDSDREKKLLMHRQEIRKLAARIMQDGMTIIPINLYLKDSLVKVEIGVAKGKKLYDKRDAAAKRDAEREIDRKLKERI